jgi:formylglycine-generating enzyme required for sulfatase activity
LPTEEEWERAARGPNGTKYPWGTESIDPSRANYDGSNIKHPTPVGLYPRGVSPEGVYDMVGNLLEWTSSAWSAGSGTYVWRGGNWDALRTAVRPSYRGCSKPNDVHRLYGFRLAADFT